MIMEAVKKLDPESCNKFPQNAASSSSSRSSQTQRLEELFKACDTKGGGVIGPDVFRELCDKFGITPEDSDKIFVDLDHDGDGYIDFEDFSYGFRDFLTPGSRRGSLQISSVADPSGNSQQLQEMEKRHASARTAWKHFMNNIGPSNIQPFISSSNNRLYNIMEEIRNDGPKDSSATLEKALTSLIDDVHHLHEEYKTLESSFKKKRFRAREQSSFSNLDVEHEHVLTEIVSREREVHAAQLVALGEELDQQLAKAEAKAKAEARHEAQRQMDQERKKIATEIENQLADLSSQIRTFQKVEEWLSEEEAREKRVRATEDCSKLHEAESENRNLRSALVEAQMKATMLQTQLTQKRNEYLDLYNVLHSEKMAASEYKSQVNLMQNHLVVLSEANRVLSDANDCLTTQTSMTFSLPPFLQSQHEAGSGHLNSSSCPNSLGLVDTASESSFTGVKQSTSDPRLTTLATPCYETDRDSGMSTLLDEIRAEGDGSPLPSGVWTTSNLSSPQNQNQQIQSHSSASIQSSYSPPRQHPDLRSPSGTLQNGNYVGKIGSSSSCCTDTSIGKDEGIASSSSYTHNRRSNLLESTYKSFEYGEDADLYETLTTAGPRCGGSHLGNRSHREDEESEKGFGSQNESTLYPHRTFKVILAGDAAVGKTTFIERICHGHFTPNLSSTIGVDFRVKTIELDGKCVALQLWDTAGQERFRSLTKSYFRRADGVILMYDVSNERTFANIRNWIHNVEEGAGRKVPIVLSGNKVDLREDRSQRPFHHVSQSDGEKLASQCGAIFVETSPKTGHNVFEALLMLAKEMSQAEDAELRNSLQLTDNHSSQEKLKKKGCCSSGNSPVPDTNKDKTCEQNYHR